MVYLEMAEPMALAAEMVGLHHGFGAAPARAVQTMIDPPPTSATASMSAPDTFMASICLDHGAHGRAWNAIAPSIPGRQEWIAVVPCLGGAPPRPRPSAGLPTEHQAFPAMVAAFHAVGGLR